MVRELLGMDAVSLSVKSSRSPGLVGHGWPHRRASRPVESSA